MKSNILFTGLLFLFFCELNAQVDVKPVYTFSDVYNVACTNVKSQGRTGTCWSFSTASFLESEVMKNGKGTADFSEMFVVRNIYLDKAKNYVLRQGKANFSQGSLAHDLMNIATNQGMVPEEVFSGLSENEKAHNHTELSNVLKGMLEGLLKTKTLSPKWKNAVTAILDVYLGAAPKEFNYKGKKYSPQSYVAELGIDKNNYVNFTSFTHHPFYQNFILEIPDNYSNGSFYNIPIDEMTALVDEALENGYSIAWDGDVSEKGFSQNEGLAILPADSNIDNVFAQPVKELSVNQNIRQAAFESFQTTDDHLMHIVGMAKDQNGNSYYKIKNSWGERGPYKGYLYMSVPYFKMKTISVMMNKEALRKEMKEKMGS